MRARLRGRMAKQKYGNGYWAGRTLFTAETPKAYHSAASCSCWCILVLVGAGCAASWIPFLACGAAYADLHRARLCAPPRIVQALRCTSLHFCCFFTIHVRRGEPAQHSARSVRYSRPVAASTPPQPNSVFGCGGVMIRKAMGETMAKLIESEKPPAHRVALMQLRPHVQKSTACVTICSAARFCALRRLHSLG